MLASDKQTDVLVMDLSKAFDKVGHGRLLHKLRHFGNRGITHIWIRGFLSGRTHEVMVEGQHSDRVPVASGVPQGKYIGVTISTDINWKQHVENITKSANKALGFLRRNLRINSVKAKEQT